MSCKIRCVNIDHALFIVTGISGSGKTTLALKMKDFFKCKLLSVDSYKEYVFDKYGFKNDYEKRILDSLAHNIFKAKLIKNMRKKKDIIVEYPFSINWQNFFVTVAREYKYTIIIVNCNTEDFQDIWNRRLSRDNSQDRHKGLVAKAYIKDKLFKGSNELTTGNKTIQEKFYNIGKYNTLYGNFIFTDSEMYNIIQ